MASDTQALTAQRIALPADTSVEDARVLCDAVAEVPGAREKFRALLERAPAWIERIGTLVGDAERAMIATGSDQMIVEETWRAELDALRRSLTQPDDGALERLLISRVAVAWLALSIAELKRQAKWKQKMSGADAEFWDRHVSRLQSDFLRASKTLAAVRRLKLPSFRVNISGQQINVAS